MPSLLLWALHLHPGVAETSIPGRQWYSKYCHSGQINTRIHATPPASALEHIEEKVMLVFVG